MNVGICNFTLSVDSFDVVVFHEGLMQLSTCSLKWILHEFAHLYCALIVFTRFVQRNETTFSKFYLVLATWATLERTECLKKNTNVLQNFLFLNNSAQLTILNL